MSEQNEHYSMVMGWSEEDQAYIVTVPELPGPTERRTRTPCGRGRMQLTAGLPLARRAGVRSLTPECSREAARGVGQRVEQVLPLGSLRLLAMSLLNGYLALDLTDLKGHSAASSCATSASR